MGYPQPAWNIPAGDQRNVPLTLLPLDPSAIGNYNIPAASGDIPDPSASGILSAGGDIPGPAPIGITADVGIFQAGRGYPRVSPGHDHRLAALKASKRRGLVSA